MKMSLMFGSTASAGPLYHAAWDGLARREADVNCSTRGEATKLCHRPPAIWLSAQTTRRKTSAACRQFLFEHGLDISVGVRSLVDDHVFSALGHRGVQQDYADQACSDVVLGVDRAIWD